MMRVEVNMSKSIRGLVDKYASEKNVTMPEAYKQLIMNGLVVSDVEYPTFNPDVEISDDVIELSKMEEGEYEIVIADGDE